MYSRPRIKIQLSDSEKFLAIAGWVAIVTVWLIPLALFHTLPDTIPLHFDSDGNINRYGSRLFVFTLPPVATFVFAILHIVGRRPYLLNYPVTITERNAPIQYALAVKALLILRFTMGIIFIFILLAIIFPEANKIIVSWMLFLSIVLLIIPITYFQIKSLKHK